VSAAQQEANLRLVKEQQAAKLELEKALQSTEMEGFKAKQTTELETKRLRRAAVKEIKKEGRLLRDDLEPERLAESANQGSDCRNDFRVVQIVAANRIHFISQFLKISAPAPLA